MGVSNYDNEAKGRRYEARFTLTTPEGVELFLRQYDAMESLRYRGDYDASALLIDMDTAIESAALTSLQRAALDLVIKGDVTQREAGASLGTTQQNARKHTQAALVKIASIYECWAWQGEGYHIPDIILRQYEEERS